MDNKTFRRVLGERLGRSAKDVDTLIGALAGLLVENSQLMRVLAVPGFGSFVPVKHEEKIITDLSTGKRVLLPPEIALEYVPGSTMRRMVDPTAPIPSDAPDAPGGMLTLPAAGEVLADTCSIEADAAERFLSEFFHLVEEEDGRSGVVTIKGIGEFRGLVFKPDEALAEEINQPFAMFEPVELEDSVSESDLEGTVSDVYPAEVESQDEEIRAEAVEEPVEAEEEHEQEQSGEFTEGIEEEPMPAGELSSEEKEDDSSDETVDEPYEETVQRSNTGLMAAVIIGVLFAFAAGFVAGRYSVVPAVQDTPVTDTAVAAVSDTVRTVADDTIAPVEEAPTTEREAEKPVYDTVTSTRFLATMAREYYGKMEYWVYIYKANEDHLANPNRIRPGTRVRIPKIEEYAVSAGDSVDLEAARRLSEEIYAPYRR